jgi:hypothetical protein
MVSSWNLFYFYDKIKTVRVDLFGFEPKFFEMDWIHRDIF